MPLPQIRSFAFTCADAERLAAFYARLGFRRGDSLTLEGPYADLVGLPGSQLKVVRLHVGAETLELMEVLSLGPGLRPGRPVPAGAKSNDRSFQHLCLVTADLDAAAAPVLQELGPAGCGRSPVPPRPCRWTTLPPPVSAPSSSAIPRGTPWSCCWSRQTKGKPAGTPARQRGRFRGRRLPPPRLAQAAQPPHLGHGAGDPRRRLRRSDRVGEPPSWEKAAMDVEMCLMLILCGASLFSLDTLLLDNLLRRWLGRWLGL